MRRSSDAGAADAAQWQGSWTWRRVPGRIAWGLAVAGTISVALFVLHVGGWGLLGRMSGAMFWQGLLIGVPVALILAFLIVAPVLARVASDGLTRAQAVRLGAIVYGGIVFLWMLLFRPGPPDLLVLWLLKQGAGEALISAVALPYRHLLTPALFALYGAFAARMGWWAAFGRAPSAAPA